MRSEKLKHIPFHVGELVWRCGREAYGVVLGWTPGNHDRFGWVDVLTPAGTKSIHWTSLEKLDDDVPQV